MTEKSEAQPSADETLSWDGVSDGMARHIFDQAEKYLKAQLDISLASDRRALTVASVFSTVALGSLGATLAHFAQRSSAPFLFAGLSATLFMIIAASYAFWAARPITFYVAGNLPGNLWPYRRKELARLLGGETENYHEFIEHNEGCLAQNADALRTGSRYALVAPIVAFVVWCISLFWFPL
jgi:hypothetical protein